MGRTSAWSLSALACCAGCSDTAALPLIELTANGSTTAVDDLVIASSPDDPERPFLLLELRLGPGEEAVELGLSAVGEAPLRFEPERVALLPGAAREVRIYGDGPSLAEADTTVELRAGGAIVASTAVTVVSGVKIALAGTFAFATDNNNGAIAPGEVCLGESDPPIWRATPLPCEGFGAVLNRLYLDDASELPRRFPTGPPIAMAVTAVATFGPEIDLAGRDPLLTTGTRVGAGDEPYAAVFYTDDCDGVPPANDPTGLNEGVEVADDVSFGVGSVLVLRYADGADRARVWTSFPTPASAAEASADSRELEAMLQRGGFNCESPGLTYFDVDGTFRCDAPQSVATLLRRQVGFRAMIRRAWANWTSRSLSADAGGDEAGSFVARLFLDASRPGAEGFLQLDDYDWFTLTGHVNKGMLSTPGGVPAQFEAWGESSGCPTPFQPDEARADDPFR